MTAPRGRLREALEHLQAGIEAVGLDDHYGRCDAQRLCDHLAGPVDVMQHAAHDGDLELTIGMRQLVGAGDIKGHRGIRLRAPACDLDRLRGGVDAVDQQRARARCDLACIRAVTAADVDNAPAGESRARKHRVADALVGKPAAQLLACVPIAAALLDIALERLHGPVRRRPAHRAGFPELSRCAAS